MGLLSSLFFHALFHNSDSRRARRDQRSLRTSVKNMISPINHYGTCFGCNGTGNRTFDCRACGGDGRYTGTCRTCSGSGLFTYAARPCFRCNGTGLINGTLCRNCGGTGQYRAEQTVACRKCGGLGQFSASCHRCSGSGEVGVTCRKCGGSGWHKF